MIRNRNISRNAAIALSKLQGGGGITAGKTFFVNVDTQRTTFFPAKDTYATIQLALNACVSGRGDTVFILPGSYAITVPITMTLADVKLMAYDEPAVGQQTVTITSPDTASGATDLIQIDADNVVVSGICFTPGNDCVNAIDIADTTACQNILVDNCRFVMAGGAASNIGVRIGDGTTTKVDNFGTFGARTTVQNCQFISCKSRAIQISAPFAHIHHNFCFIEDDTIPFFGLDDYGGAEAVAWGAYNIHDNMVSGNTTAADETLYVADGAEANTSVGLIHHNYIHGAIGTDAINPECWVSNYGGSEAGEVLLDPKA